ncbi:MAG: hypothetical protein CBC00_06855 [Verrucomicrobia bacterium TMED40]|nr:MAG: hypothetical protein CBC00_06855 [Verrucomicrobia bacterium TMED40]|tara:strand:+ start:2906 stop:3124 length:219 start_codon:yes stop_codon:yes gene_type:complete
MTFEYKTVVVSPSGLRVKGDDHSKELAELLSKNNNKLAKAGWRLISMNPSMTSQGAVVKMLITLERKIEEDS